VPQWLINTPSPEEFQKASSHEQSQMVPIRIDFRSVQEVVVTAEGAERFVITSREAARACHSALGDKDWEQEFKAFLTHIYEWAKTHAEIVTGAYVGIGSEGLSVVVITRGEEYRIDFEDALTDLDIELARLYSNCRADVLQSPEDELEGGIPYVSQERTLQVYGNSGGLSGQS
jgi:hypothetical protein